MSDAFDKLMIGKATTGAASDYANKAKKLSALWNAAEKPKADDSVERMRARNTAIRLAKGIAPRTPDDDEPPPKKAA